MRLYLSKKEANLVKVALALEMVNMTDEQKKHSLRCHGQVATLRTVAKIGGSLKEPGLIARFTWEPGNLPGCQVGRTGSPTILF